ncbi:glutaredoxin family protein [Georgenia satyanarayanai]|uniref:glutaredoxin family protein n=1 Tax=Georgenia satyanarayanai TaxID=860221 RepID=UPI001D033A4D|nr:glutaredoxin family protein [Georgenia satyanarayanai]
MPESRVVLYSRAGCHLCDEARAVVLAECDRARARWREVDVDADPQLQARYGEYVPVVEVDGTVQGFWHLDPARVREALDNPSNAES